jgi:hypothetical protein
VLLAILLLCQSATLHVAPGGPLCRADADHGALYYSICGTNFIRRTDGTTVFTAAGLLSNWDIVDGVIAASGSLTTIVTPDGVRRELAFDDVVLQPRIHDGYVYWLSGEGTIRRMAIAGDAVEMVAHGVAIDSRFRYAVFGDRIVFATTQGLHVQSLTGGAPALLLPRADINSVAAVTAEGVLVTTSGRGFAGAGYAQLLHVPWIGTPVETIYQVATPDFLSGVSLTAAVAGATTYIAQYVTTGCCGTYTELLVLRDGVAQRRYRNAAGTLTILEADEEAVIVVESIGSSTMRKFERICAAAPRGRAVSRR